MSWVFKSVGDASPVAGSGPINVTYPASIAAGDILVCAAGVDSASFGAFTVSDAGFQSIVNGQTGGTTQLFWKIATGSESGTFTVDLSGNFIYAQCARFTGGPATLVGNIDNTNTGGSGSNTVMPWGALTPVAQNCLVIAVTCGFMGAGSSSGIDNPAPWTATIGTTFNSSDVFGWSYVIQTVATTVAAGWWTPSGTPSGNSGSSICSLVPGAIAPILGKLTTAGPGVSPTMRLQFQASRRSNFAPIAPGAGQSYSISTSFGQLTGVGAISGVSYSATFDYGTMGPIGALAGYSYGFSQVYGGITIAPSPKGYIPKGGPGISPSTLFQFSTLELATTNPPLLSQGNSFSFSNSYGKLTGAMALPGVSYSFTFSYGNAQAGGAVGQLIGVSYSFSTDYGALVGLNLAQIAGQSYTVSNVYGGGANDVTMPNLIGLTPGAAIALLNSAGFFAITEGAGFSAITPPGLVYQQAPQAGTLVAYGSAVTIVVSAGPYVRPPSPNLGYKVTSRTFSLEEMASREWGPDFRAPDHRVYVWSNNRGFDSTDLGTTGIYQKGTSTS